MRIVSMAAVSAVLLMVGAGAQAAEPVGRDATKGDPAPASPPAESAEKRAVGVVVEAKVCKNLKDRDPVDVGDTFKISDGQVITWSRVTGGAGSEIHHVYFLGDRQIDDVTLKIGGSPWRTSSRKTLRADMGMSGQWRVEIRDAGGAVLETLSFTVE